MPESTTRLDAHDAATQARLEAAERVVGHRFTDPARLLCALTHSSAKRPDHPSNERLEFLGDSILGLVIAERLYALFPDQPEGELTRVKAAVVSAQSIGPRARACGLSRLVEVGGGFASEQNVSLSMCADLFEAVIGALYLDAGLAVTGAWIRSQLDPVIDEVSRGRDHVNWKSRLQQHTQKNRGDTPDYRLEEARGPDHKPSFEVSVWIDAQRCGLGRAATKKAAEQAAAREACAQLCPLASDRQSDKELT